MSNLISREKAIEALERAKKNIHHNIERAIGDAICEILDEVENGVKQLPSAEPKIVRCKDCKHFEYDYVVKVDGIPLIVAHEICMRWGDGVKTSENGYCFLAERKEVTT